MNMKVWLCAFLCLFILVAKAQKNNSFIFNTSNPSYQINSEESELLARKYNLKMHKYRLTSPRLDQFTPTAADRSASSYWTNAITMQSYGRGKVGTFYYWDVQGNLRDMRGFIDIAGKNKRGLKLVFPWR